MFRKIYHQANDDIPVNEELLNAILAANQPKKNKFLYPRFTIAASILILSASILAYPQLKDNFNTDSNDINPPQITLPAVTAVPSQTPVPSAEPTDSAPIQSGNNDIEKNADAAKKNIPAAKAEHKIKTNKKTHLQTTAPAPEAPNPPHTQMPEQSEQNVSPSDSSIPSQTAQASETADTKISDEGSVLGLTSDKITRDSLVTENWSKERYFEYLGTEIKPDVPCDLEEVSSSEKNMTLYQDTKTPYYDMWTLKYESEDKTRTVSVKISKNTVNADKDTGTEQNPSDSDETKMTLNYSPDAAHAEAEKDNVSLIVDAAKLTQEEFDILCSSLVN